MYHTILVPLDGSERAEAILPHVEELAMRFAARVVLLEIVVPFYTTAASDGSTPLMDPDMLEQEKSDARAYLAGIQARLEAKGIAAESQVICSGSVVSNILETARQTSADLIAMASHGRTGLARVFYGSVAVGVLHAADRPLLLVRSLNA